ncbi:MAG: dihydroorotase [bacterium]|nr:dihydroorotase [bacterium]
MQKILIKNGHLVDPAQQIDGLYDILLEGDKVVQCSNNINDNNAKIIDAQGKYVFPGLIDIHVHLREPGGESKETIYTGTRAAVKGGFTTICCMPNTRPSLDNVPSVEYINLKSEKDAVCNVYPVGCVTKGLDGTELAEIGSLVQAGVIAISDDGCPVSNAFIMRRALEYCKIFDIPVISHCEDRDLAQFGVMNEGAVSTKLGLRGIPNAAEEVMVARDIILAEQTSGYVHIAHVSTKGSVALIRDAKKRGVKITAETAPHYFTLTDFAVEGYNTYAKMNPPLRTAEDVAGIKEGLKDGTLDCIASDHAPHTKEEKNKEFDFAPFGIIGLETELALAYQELVLKEKLSLSSVIEKLTKNPAEVMRLKTKGSLKIGFDADLIIFDGNEKFKANNFISKSSNSPFLGWELQGVINQTIVAGKVVYKS